MNRKNSPASKRSSVFVEALEPRIAPAGLINESKFTSVTLGTPLLLDASGGPNDFQGISTGFGNTGAYLLYLTSGKALVYTTDLNGNGRFDPNEITGISLGVDSQGRAPSLILFSDVNGDIVTNLRPGHGVSALTDSDFIPGNGNDGRILLGTSIGNITMRTITASDLDPTIAGNTVNNRLELTSFSIYGNIVTGGNFGGLTIDTSGDSDLATKFTGIVGEQLYRGSTPQVEGIYTGTAANNLSFSFTHNNSTFTPNVGGALLPFQPAVLAHGGDISNIQAASTGTVFSIGTLATGDGGAGARGGNISAVTFHGATGSYELLAGNGGSGATGGQGGSILGFNDLGSVTGEAFLHTGDGGTGSFGAGGAGGLATFATTKIAAAVHVAMGNGGDGITAGGDGASFTSAVFTTPNSPLPIGSKIIGTWHDLGDLGNTHPNADGTSSPEVINFNAPSFFGNATDAARYGDTFGDAVFTTTGPDQVVVEFGNGAAGLIDNQGNYNGTISATVVLKVPGIRSPVVTVGDFNGDGRPDIAVASGAADNFSGVYVFINQIGTALDPINGRNYTKSPLGDHPFSAPRQSTLPYEPDSGLFEAAGAILALTSGDFNGDGLTDIAYVQRVTSFGLAPFQSVGYLLGTQALQANGTPVPLDPVTHRAVGTGYFFANASAPGAAPLLQSTIFIPGDNPVLRASSAGAGNAPNATTGLPATAELLFYGVPGAREINQLSSFFIDPTTHLPLTGFLIDTIIGLDRVDTNRNLGPNSISLQAATLQTFTLQDVDGDGSVDIVALTKSPANFIVDFQGDGVGGFILASMTGDNAGVFIGNQIVVTTMAPSDAGVLNADGTTFGIFNGLGLLVLPNDGPAPFIQEVFLADNTGAPNFYGNAGSPVGGRLFNGDFLIGQELFLIQAKDQPVQALDTFYVDAPTFPTAANPAGTDLHPAAGFALLAPNTSTYLYSYLSIFGVPGDDPAAYSSEPTFSRYLTENGYIINSGNGGNSRSGAGGAGGTIGGALTAGAQGQVAGAIAITFPTTLEYQGQAYLQGGSGGNGFSTGGAGGSVSGFSVRYAVGTALFTSDVQITAGNGGNGNISNGGRGGNLSSLSVETGTVFTAGNGGSGAQGGAGGSILGNQQGLFDVSGGVDLISADNAILLGITVGFGETQVNFAGVGLIAGKGGPGALLGGAGGSITDWHSEFLNATGIGFQLSYNAGAGGSSAGGIGGVGGSILRSSPDVNLDNLSGALTLRTGAGGNGLTGGAGGNLDTFINRPTNPSAIPSILTVTAGAGGIGVSGSGGAGGSISNFLSNATGLFPTFDLSQAGLARVIAGDGAQSYGGAGGAGGSIAGVSTQATSTPMLVAGGAGGLGLLSGGTGGSVTNSTLNSLAGQNGKLLIVAGTGGDAVAALPSDIVLPDDPNNTDLAHAILAFGGVTGRGGDGGNISGITQPTGVQTAVDLIAGNGGSTQNAGNALSAVSNVGRGGSVTNVNLAGTVGAINRNTTQGIITNPPIQAYTFTDATGTANTSVSALVDFIKAGDGSFVLNDAVGNVGIVAGAAGTVRGAQPAPDGINGSVQNITASSIMSIVAGSVNRVAPVRLVSGLTVTNVDGVLGVDRRLTPVTLPNGQLSYSPNGQLDYLDEAGNLVQNLQAGYRLIDGAIFAQTVQQTQGGQVIGGPRVFFPRTT